MKARFGGKGCVCGKKAMYVRRGIHGAEIYGDIPFLKTETACNEFCRAWRAPPPPHPVLHIWKRICRKKYNNPVLGNRACVYVDTDTYIRFLVV